MAVDLNDLLSQLDSQTIALHDALENASTERWELATPAERWSVRDQVTHLAFFDEMATTAVLFPARFRIEAKILTAGGMDFPDRIAQRYASIPGEEALRWFRKAREDFTQAIRCSDPEARLPWFGPDMSVASTVTARLMETWGHGRDIHDALGTPQPAGPELRSISHLGVATFSFVHELNGREVPSSPPHVALVGPAGEQWSWGPADSTNSVRGSAEDFVLAVTQRRHISDTDLKITGEVARNWMDIAQAYAGAPGTGRTPRRQLSDSSTDDGLASDR